MNATEFIGCITALRPFDEKPPDYTWDRHCYELRIHAAKNKPEDFLNWSTITATMFVGNAPYIIKEWNALCQDIDSERWLEAVKDPGFGNPQRVPFANFTSGNYIHQTYHLMQWERASHRRIDSLRKIVEFGGGYGSACAIARALGFKGEYVIYDRPEFSVLQEFYLSNIGIEAHFEKIFTYKERNREYWWIDVDPGADLLIACYSLSEVDALVRDEFFNTLEPDSVLIAHQEMYAGRDIRAEFDQFLSDHPQYNWKTIPCISIDGHKYRIGERSDL